MKPTKEQVINNAVASAEMEGLHPTEADIARIVDLLEKESRMMNLWHRCLPMRKMQYNGCYRLNRSAASDSF